MHLYQLLPWQGQLGVARLVFSMKSHCAQRRQTPEYALHVILGKDEPFACDGLEAGKRLPLQSPCEMTLQRQMDINDEHCPAVSIIEEDRERIRHGEVLEGHPVVNHAAPEGETAAAG